MWLKFDLYSVRGQVVRLAEALPRVLPPGLAEGPKLGHAGSTCSCSVHQSHSGLSSRARACSILWRPQAYCPRCVSAPRQAVL